MNTGGYRWFDKPARLTSLGVLLAMPQHKPAKRVAADLGISPTLLSLYAYGRKPIPIARIEPFCEYFSVTPKELLTPPDPNSQFPYPSYVRLDVR